MVSIHILYTGDKKCSAAHDDSQVTIYTDAPRDVGGDGSSFSPTDLVAAGLGSCIATTMAMFAERHELDLSGLKVFVTKEMYTGTPRRIAALKATVTVPAGRIPADQRAVFERVGHTCPISQSLHPDVEQSIKFVYED